MKNNLLFVFTFVLLVASLLAACGPSAPAATPTPASSPTPSGDAAAGKQAYTSTCIACHGPDAKGMPNLGKDLTTSEWVRTKSNAELVDFLKVGRPAGDVLNTTGVDMPPKGGNPALTDADLLNIVAFIRSIQQ